MSTKYILLRISNAPCMRTNVYPLYLASATVPAVVITATMTEEEKLAARKAKFGGLRLRSCSRALRHKCVVRSSERERNG